MSKIQPAMPLGVTAVMLPELDFAEQLALCRELGVTHYSLRPRIIGADQRDKPFSNWGNHKFDLTPTRLVREARAIRRQMDDAGITPFGTVPSASVSASESELKEHFEGAAAVGAGRVRVAPLAIPQGPFDYEALLDQTVQGYGRAIELAKPFGQKLVIETHAWSLATSPALAWNICRHFDPTEIGVIFDLPNFALEGYVQPRLAVAVLRKYIDHLHIGGAAKMSNGYDGIGYRQTVNRMTPLDQSDLHIPSWLAALREAGVQAPLIIEDYTEQVPGALRLRLSVAALRRALEAA